MPLQFHILDVYSQDLKVELETSEEKHVKYIKNDENDEDRVIPTQYTPFKYEFVIHLFGMTEKGKSIRVSINGFEPFFYIELPDSKKQTYEDFKYFLKAKCNPLLFSEINLTFLKKEKLYGYTNRKLFPFVMIQVKSIRSFRSVKQLFLNKDLSPKIEKYRVYEANLDPMLRFFHLRNISPCGWCIIDIDENEIENTLEIDWEDISPQPNPPRMVAPFHSGFWDIECYSHSGDFPVATKDPVIQIGIVFSKDDIITEKHIFVLGGCNNLDDIVVHSYPTEKEMIIGFLKLCNEKNPDSLNGYNTFGFDERYLYERMEVLRIHTSEHFQTLSRIRDITVETMAVELQKKMLSSSALGDNNLYLWTTTGRLHIDLYFYIKRIENLSSYKLDDVCSHYMSGKLKSVEKKELFWSIKTSSTNDAEIGKYVILIDDIGDTIIEKCKIINIIQSKEIHIEIPREENNELLSSITKWVIVKDDISPADIFRLHRGSDADRALVAKYCIQDCVLVFQLYKKLDVFNNAMAMANTCSVPISFIFTRGQGIKCESLIFKECAERNQLIEVLLQPSENGTEESYEGAIVLDPTPKFYSDSPVGVADFASLYPSTIYSENISYDTLLWAKDYDLEYNFIGYSFGCKENDMYITPDITFTHIEFDIWKADVEDLRKNPTKNVVGKRVCCYVQEANDRKGTLPDIISKLLAARKSKRKQAEKEADAFKKALLDAEQLAYKLTANSLYGQLGSSMFKVRLQNLAASVTAYGRKQILFAKEVIEKFYGPEANDPRCCADGAEIVYGDSVASYTPVMIRRNGLIEIIAIEELGDKWVSTGEKEFCNLVGVESWTENGWTPIERVIRHQLAPTKKIIRVLTHTGIVDATDDHSLIKLNGEEISPKNLVIGDELLHNEYPKDSLKNIKLLNNYDCYYDLYDNNLQKYIANECLIASQKGYNISFEIEDSMFHISYTKENITNPNKIKKLYEIPYTGYVYDLTTNNHHFQAGIGKLIVHNTDSLFINFNVRNPITKERLTGKEAIEQTMKLTEEAGKFVTRCLKTPHDFEYDKVFSPFIILSKKRYVGNKFEDSSEDYKQTSMGIATKRRDYAPIVKNIYGGAIQILLTEKDVIKAYNFVRKTCYELIEGNISLYQLTMTKSLKSEYKMATPPAHKVLANRITQRDPGNAPSSGTRLQFLYILPPVGQVSSKLQGDRVETPHFIKENKLKIDYMFYLEHQIQNPIIQLFALFVEQLPGYSRLDINREEIARQLLFNDIYRKCNNQHVKNFGEKFGFTILPKADTIIRANKCSVPINRKKQMVNQSALQRTLIQQFNDIKSAKKKVIEDQKKTDKEKLKKLTLEL